MIFLGIGSNQESKFGNRFDNISGGLQLFAERITERWIKGNIKKSQDFLSSLLQANFEAHKIIQILRNKKIELLLL